MMIAVFNFNNDSVDIISVDKAYIDDIYSSDTERYLVEELMYNPEEICFMSDVRSINFADFDILNQIK